MRITSSRIPSWLRPRLCGAPFRKAIELKPGYASGHHWYSYYLAELGQLEEALREIRRAQELEPLSVVVGGGISQLEYLARHYDRASAQAMQAMEINPAAPGPHVFLGMAYHAQGRTPEAVRELEKARALDDSGEVAGWGGYFDANVGNRDAAAALLQTMKARSERFVPAYSLAMIHAGLGEADMAFEWLEKAFEDHSEGMAWLNVDPRLEGLRSDARLKDLVRRVGLPTD
jgi:tetratricopeptide (TPR) repeat protein